MHAPYSRTRTQSDHEQRTGQEQDVGETTRLQCNSCGLFDGKTEKINLRYTTSRLMVSIAHYGLFASGAISKPLN